jgi:hypothetical protein
MTDDWFVWAFGDGLIEARGNVLRLRQDDREAGKAALAEYKARVRSSGYSAMHVRAIIKTCRAYPKAERVQGATWQCHKAAMIAPAAERGLWLAMAVRENLAPVELKTRIQGKATAKQPRRRSAGGLATIQGVTWWFGRWLTKATRAGGVEQWSEAQKEQVRQQLEAMVELYWQLEQPAQRRARVARERREQMELGLGGFMNHAS